MAQNKLEWANCLLESTHIFNELKVKYGEL